MSVIDSAQSDSDKAQGRVGNITSVTLPGRHVLEIRHVKYDDSLFFVRVLRKFHPYYRLMPLIKTWHKRCITKTTSAYARFD